MLNVDSSSLYSPIFAYDDMTLRTRMEKFSRQVMSIEDECLCDHRMCGRVIKTMRNIPFRSLRMQQKKGRRRNCVTHGNMATDVIVGVKHKS